MKTPTVHLNGTSREYLLQANQSAGHAVMAAIEALQQATPNGRDYYPQGDGAYEVARKEHNQRLLRLETVLDELQQIAQAITEAGR